MNASFLLSNFSNFFFHFVNIYILIWEPQKAKNGIGLFKHDITNRTSNVCKIFGMKLTDKQRDLHLMHWTPNIHKCQIGVARFIVASTICILNH